MENNKNILIIESERIVGRDLQVQLEDKGFSVQNPISHVDTEAIIFKYIPDLIIADSSILKERLFERIKKYLRNSKLPFIWIGTLKKKEVIKESVGINVIGTFLKPFDSTEVVAKIGDYLKDIPSLRRKGMNDEIHSGCI